MRKLLSLALVALGLHLPARADAPWRTLTVSLNEGTGDAQVTAVQAALRDVQGIDSIAATSNGIAVRHDWSSLSAMNIVRTLEATGLGVKNVALERSAAVPRVASDPAESWPQQFARVKYAQMKSMSRNLGYVAPDKVTETLKLAASGNAAAFTNDLDRIYSGLWHEPGTPVRPDAYRMGEQEREALGWFLEFLKETGGCYEALDYWSTPLLTDYAHTIVAGMPSNSIYFGGTDTGRFLIQAFRELERRDDLIPLTQNCLADDCALGYFRYLYGDHIYLPSRQDSTNLFEDIVQKVQSGALTNRDFSFEGGRVEVTGVSAVMLINGELLRAIFEANKKTRQFFVEESYVIDWMYPYLEPHGFILKLNAEKLATLPADTVRKDRAFWDAQTKALLADERFLKAPDVRRAYSKNRCSIAGVYQRRGLFEEAEYAFLQAIALGPESLEPTYRLADFYQDRHRAADAIKVLRALRSLQKEPEQLQRTDEFIKKLGDLK